MFSHRYSPRAQGRQPCAFRQEDSTLRKGGGPQRATEKANRGSREARSDEWRTAVDFYVIAIPAKTDSYAS
jgi:hypothetical protein